MSEIPENKRFEVHKVSGNFGEWEVEDTVDGSVVMDRILHKYLADKLCDKLNRFAEENEQLKSDLDYFQRTYEIEERGLNIVAPMCTIGSPTPSRLELFKENEELRQRNDSQAKQLDNLYQLIEQKDWRALSDILDDFERCEEQLQSEWKCYE